MTIVIKKAKVLLNKLKKYLNKGSKRSSKAKKNILAMFFIKGFDILLGLIQIPLILHYVDSDTYGIFITLSTMVTWMRFFDIGINNGLKNRLTEALAKNDIGLAKKYVSTTYVILSLIFIPLMIILLIISPKINWYSLLNISPNITNGLFVSISIIISYFCINFILSTINVVLSADQRPADASLRSLITHLGTVITIFILTMTTEGTLTNLCLALCLVPLLIMIVFNITLFRGRYIAFRPSLGSVDFNLTPSLMKLGFQFFLIQIAGIIQYQLINFLIIRYFGASDVTAYNIAYRYFGMLYMVWGILMSPVWAAVTDAITKQDYEWVRSTIKKYEKIYIIFILVSLLLLLLSSSIYSVWIGDKVHIPFVLSFWVMLYNLVLMFGSTYVMVLNGSGHLKIQTIASLFSPFVFLGMAYILIHNEYGVYSILIASIVANFNGYLLGPIQCKRLFGR